MGMEDPIPQFSHLASQLANRHPSLAYIHVVEPRVSGQDDCEMPVGEVRLAIVLSLSPSLLHLLFLQSNDFLREIWRPRPLISAGGYTPEIALETAEKKGDLIAFGRSFISNVSRHHRNRDDMR